MVTSFMQVVGFSSYVQIRSGNIFSWAVSLPILISCLSICNSMGFVLKLPLAASNKVFSMTAAKSFPGKQWYCNQQCKYQVVFLIRQRDDSLYDIFYSKIFDVSGGLTNQPISPWLKKLSRWRDSASSVHVFETPKAYITRSNILKNLMLLLQLICVHKTGAVLLKAALWLKYKMGQ